MKKTTSNLSTFLAELKRRRVFRVAAVYAGVAFVVIQIIDGAFEYLPIPDWVGTAIIILLLVGFPIAVGLAWAFDITEKGVVRTAAKEEADPAERPPRPLLGNITLAFVAALAVVVAVWSWWDRSRDPLAAFEHSLVVMPFDNLTDDPHFDVWEKGMAKLLIDDLVGSEELYVLDYQTLIGIIDAIESVKKAQVLPDLAREVASRSRVRQVITGDLMKAGEQLRLQAQLLDDNTGELVFTHRVEGETEDDFFVMAMELSDRLRNHLEIKAMQAEGEEWLQRWPASTTSAKAYRAFIQAVEHFASADYTPVKELLNEALDADSSFADAYSWLAIVHGNQGNAIKAREMSERAYHFRARANRLNQLYINWNRSTFQKDPYRGLFWLKQANELEPQVAGNWYLTGWIYLALGEYRKVIKPMEKALSLHQRFGTSRFWVGLYTQLGSAYHETGNHKRELEVYQIGLESLPEQPGILLRLASEYVSRGDTVLAREYRDRYAASRRERGATEARIVVGLGWIYREANMLDQAQDYYRRAIKLAPEDHSAYGNFAWLLIDNDLDVEQGMVQAQKALELQPDNYSILDTYGWGLYKAGRYNEALDVLEKSWELRPYYNHKPHTRLEVARKAVGKH